MEFVFPIFTAREVQHNSSEYNQALVAFEVAKKKQQEN